MEATVCTVEGVGVNRAGTITLLSTPCIAEILIRAGGIFGYLTINEVVRVRVPAGVHGASVV